MLECYFDKEIIVRDVSISSYVLILVSLEEFGTGGIMISSSSTKAFSYVTFFKQIVYSVKDFLTDYLGANGCCENNYSARH